MSGWGGGYVTDIEYIRGYYAVQSPHHMAVACLLNGLAVDPPWENPGLHYLELGCGRGFGATVLAAANPGWRVTAVDFNPGAIAEARRFARQGGIDNIRFIEADLAGFAETAEARGLGEVDVVSLHGVWSWVGDPVRGGIVRLLRDRLRAGGMCHVSYVGLPAMQGALGVQRLLFEAGTRLAGRSDRQVVAGREVVQALFAAEARHLRVDPGTAELVGRIETAPVPYLAHEFMNRHWRPCFHADVVGELSEARLDYAGSLMLVENFPELMLTEAQRAVHDRFDDPLLRELVVDTCTNRTLRHDVFVRGRTRLGTAARDAALGAVRLVLAQRVEDFAMEIDLPAGKASLNPLVYRPMIEALAEGPCDIAELLALPEIAGQRDNPGEALAMLAGTYRAAIAPHATVGADPRMRRFNAVVARRDVTLATLGEATAMASARLGAGFPCRAVELFLVDRIGAAGGGMDPAVFAAELAPGLPAEEFERLTAMLARVMADRLPVWQNLGLL